MALAWLHPLAGSKAALLLVIGTQVYLPGLLLARALGKLSGSPIMRLAWTLLCGLSVTICLGAAARFLLLPIPVYLLLLHALMLALAFAPAPPHVERWRLDRRMLPYYALLACCCLVVLLVAHERSRLRFNGYEDQTVFVSQAQWLADHPDAADVIDRRVGVPPERLDRRWETDGWTYTHAVWVWVSEVPAADLIWHDLAPLFAWAVPLVAFGVVYVLTQSEKAATWSAVALTITGLMTLDGLVYNPTTIAFGQFAVLQMNTLRTFSTALLLPLALMAALDYLRQPRYRDLLLILLAGLALAVLHPRQIVIFQIAIAATAVLWWLSQPSRRRLVWAGLLLAVLVSLAALPYLQRLSRPQVLNRTERIEQTLFAAEDEAETSASLIVIGGTYIMNPAKVFYHPLLILAALVGLGAGWWWRRSLAAQYLFATTAALLAVFFVPGLAALVARLVTLTLFSGLIFLLPVAASLGIALHALLDWLSARWQVAALVTSAGLMVVLLVEPFPIPASARDQLHAANSIQSSRDIRPFDTALLDELKRILPADQRHVLMTPEHVASYIVESVPNTLITGGRPSSNLAHPANARFFTQPGRGLHGVFPWLDSVDLDAMREYGVTHVVMQARDSRLPQIILQPERFEPVGQAVGYQVFALRDDAPDTLDARFAAMNQLYSEMAFPRWEPADFALPRPADPEPWREIAAEWTALLQAEPDNPRAQYGLAFTYVMMGEDEAALPLWAALSERYPALSLFREAEAHSLRQLQREAFTAPLLAGLNHPEPTVQVSAARTLLTEPFAYALSAADRQQIEAVIGAQGLLWYQLAEFDQYRQVRERVAILLSTGDMHLIPPMLARMPAVELSPQDMALLAQLQPTANDALNTLRPALDAGWYAPNARIHPDRWERNPAAALYDLLMQDQTLTGSGQLFVTEPHIMQQDGQLIVSATFNNPYPGFYPVRTWRVQLTSPDTTERYALVDTEARFAEPALTRASITLELPADLPELTPALVFIEPLHSETIRYPGLTLPVVLNKPAAAALSAGSSPTDYRFGEHIRLRGYEIDSGTVTLYWETEQALAENYQIFVHVLSEDGTIIAQDDGAPAGDRYPTSDWLPDTLIADVHMLPTGEHDALRIGLYRLPDLTRLPITPADAWVQDNSLTLR